jgi:hypothetical protein
VSDDVIVIDSGRIRRAFKGICGGKPANLEEQAGRSVQRRFRRQRRQLNLDKDPRAREQIARVQFGAQQLDKLISREEMKLKARRKHRRKRRRLRRKAATA